jgi:hypothetical protein
VDQFGNTGRYEPSLDWSARRRRPRPRPSWKVVAITTAGLVLVGGLVAGALVVKNALDDFADSGEVEPTPTRANQPVAPTPSTLPPLGGYVQPVRLVVEAIPVESRSDPTVVAEAVRKITAGNGIRVEHDTRAGVIGVSATRGADCVLVRVGDDVEVWSPGQVSPVYRNPGDSSCSPFTAIQRGYQHAPH